MSNLLKDWLANPGASLLQGLQIGSLIRNRKVKQQLADAATMRSETEANRQSLAEANAPFNRLAKSAKLSGDLTRNFLTSEGQQIERDRIDPTKAGVLEESKQVPKRRTQAERGAGAFAFGATSEPVETGVTFDPQHPGDTRLAQKSYRDPNNEEVLGRLRKAAKERQNLQVGTQYRKDQNASTIRIDEAQTKKDDRLFPGQILRDEQSSNPTVADQIRAHHQLADMNASKDPLGNKTYSPEDIAWQKKFVGGLDKRRPLISPHRLPEIAPGVEYPEDILPKLEDPAVLKGALRNPNFPVSVGLADYLEQRGLLDAEVQELLRARGLVPQ